MNLNEIFMFLFLRPPTVSLHDEAGGNLPAMLPVCLSAWCGIHFRAYSSIIGVFEHHSAHASLLPLAVYCPLPFPLGGIGCAFLDSGTFRLRGQNWL